MTQYTNDYERAFHELRPAKISLLEVANLLQKVVERFQDKAPYDLDLALVTVQTALIHLARSRSLFAKEAGLPRHVEVEKPSGPVIVLHYSWDLADNSEGADVFAEKTMETAREAVRSRGWDLNACTFIPYSETGKIGPLARKMTP
jgi:hypothetical protein